MNRTITAIIPVRGGSVRLKNKNILPFGESNLLVHKIRQLKKVPEITSIVVSSDSDEMLDMARQEGVLTHKRSWEYCDEKTKSFGEVVKNVCENVEGENIMWSPCVNPLVEPQTYSNAINKYFGIIKEGYDSLFSVEAFKRFLWNENEPVNYKLGLGHVPSQQLPTYYFMVNGFFIAPRNKMIEWYYFHGTKPYKFVLDKRSSVDIDDELDLLQARAWLKV
jgi:CMP-N-acetylneuraminic acid synthetase